MSAADVGTLKVNAPLRLVDHHRVAVAQPVDKLQAPPQGHVPARVAPHVATRVPPHVPLLTTPVALDGPQQSIPGEGVGPGVAFGQS